MTITITTKKNLSYACEAFFALALAWLTLGFGDQIRKAVTDFDWNTWDSHLLAVWFGSAILAAFFRFLSQRFAQIESRQLVSAKGAYFVVSNQETFRYS